MIEIGALEQKWEPLLERLDPSAHQAYLYNPDVFPETALEALFEEVPVAFAFLSRGTVNDGILGLDVTLAVDPEKENALEGGAVLLEELKALLPKLEEEFSEEYPEVRVQLDAWSSAGRTDYMEYLTFCGFSAGRTMYAMTKDLSEEEGIPQPSWAEVILPDGKKEKVFIEILDPRDPDVRRAYLKANGLGFGYPDSEQGLLFRAEHWGARIAAFVRKKVNGEREILAAVTVWPRKQEGMATEDIFCIPAFRRQGLTEKLLRYIFTTYAGQGRKRAGLNVFSHNLPALALYRKLGYTEADTMTELRYRREEVNDDTGY